MTILYDIVDPLQFFCLPLVYFPQMFLLLEDYRFLTVKVLPLLFFIDAAKEIETNDSDPI